MTLNMCFSRYVALKLQKYPQKWIARNKFTLKSGITGDYKPTGSKVIFYWRRRPSWRPSWISQIAQGYPINIRLMFAIKVLRM